MELINKNTKEVIKSIVSFDALRGIIELEKDNGNILEPFNCLAAYMALNPDWVNKESFIDWPTDGEAAQKQFRYFVPKDLIPGLILNYKPLIDELFKEPKNPMFEEPAGVTVYQNSFIEGAREILENLNITIVENPYMI